MSFMPKWIRQLAAVGILLAVIAAVYGWAAAPLFAIYAENREAILQAQELLARYESIAATRARYEAQRDELLESLATSGTYLRGNTHALAAVELQDRVTTAVRANGGELQSIRILPAKEKGDFQRVSVQVQLAIKTEDLYRILYTLEASTPILFIDNLDVKSRANRRTTRSQDEPDDDPELRVRMDLSAYLQPEIG